MLTAGYKLNVIPGEAVAEVDTRVVPGGEADSGARWSGSSASTWTWSGRSSNAPVVAPVDGPLVETVRAAVAHDDPDGVVVPYLLPASTDNKSFSRLGIAGYGFTPLRVPDGFDAFGQFHAVDERVPLTALRFGARVMRRILRTA